MAFHGKLAIAVKNGGEQLVCIFKALGPPPAGLFTSSTFAKTCTAPHQHVLRDTVLPASRQCLSSLFDMALKCLQWDPAVRPTAQQCFLELGQSSTTQSEASGYMSISTGLAKAVATRAVVQCGAGVDEPSNIRVDVPSNSSTTGASMQSAVEQHSQEQKRPCTHPTALTLEAALEHLLDSVDIDMPATTRTTCQDVSTQGQQCDQNVQLQQSTESKQDTAAFE
jgi:hypothetical protein